jgi:uncharacterized protein with HEPN domain
MPLLELREYFKHILDETGYLTRNSEGLAKDVFLGAETLQRAFVRSLEIIGEAVKVYSTGYAKYLYRN